MSNYKFETPLLGLSENAVHLLRSRYNYETIDFASIDKIEIIKGKQVENWFVLLLIGIFLFTFGLFTGYKVIYEFFFANNFWNFHVEQLILPVFPLLLGPYSIYYSLINGYVLKITTDNKSREFPIKEINKDNQINELSLFFEQNISTRNKFNSLG